MHNTSFKKMDKSVIFLKKFKRDSFILLFLGGPLFILMTIAYFFLNSNLRLPIRILLIIPPFIGITYFFYVIPLVVRRKLMKSTVKSYYLENDKFVINTFDWFFTKSEKQSFHKDNIIQIKKRKHLLNYELLQLKVKVDKKYVNLYLLPTLYDTDILSELNVT